MPDLRNALQEALMKGHLKIAREGRANNKKKLELFAQVNSVADFRRVTRQVLRNNPIPSLLQEIITLANKRKLWEQGGGKKLISGLRNMKEFFGPTPKSKWNEVLDLEIPAE